MEEKEPKKVKISLGTVICIIIIIVLLLVIGGMYYYYNYYCKNDIITITNNDIKNINQISNNLKDSTNTITKNLNQTDVNIESNEVATSIAQKIYENAYDAILDGAGLEDPEAVEITIGNDNTVAGKRTIKAYKLDFSKIEPYFSERALNYIKMYFTDTPYGHTDGNYYIFYDCENWQHDKEFMNTIFGQTDQNKRTLNVKFYDENMMVAVSNNSSFFGGDEYLILKKVNNVWEIDMFEEF